MAGIDQARRTIYLSKSDFLNHQICPGYSWIVKHRPELVPAEVDPPTARRLIQGESVEALVRTMYPDGELIETLDPVEAHRRTQAAIAAGTETIYQAAVLTASGLLARADILTRAPHGCSHGCSHSCSHGCWDLIEVKASTDARDHRVDAAFQAIAFMQAGYELRSVKIMHLDRAYRRAGEPDPRRMMVLHDATAYVDDQLTRLTDHIDRARAAIDDPETLPPCACHLNTKSRRCPAFAHFHPDLSEPGGVYDLAMVHASTIRQVLERGVRRLADWPAEVRISARQQRQLVAHRTGVELIDAPALRSFLRELAYPLHFLDYETAEAAVPRFDGHAPWQKVPFQYSLHIVERDVAPRHHQFLWTTPGVDPVRSLATRLEGEIGAAGSIIVWNKSFEAGCNRIMAELYPPAAPFLLAMNDRMIDLADVISKGHWVHPAFGGRWSLKVVLPVVAPELAYDRLEIGNGGLASVQWARCVLDEPGEVPEPEREAIFAALRDYCHLDTLAMVRTLEHIRNLADG